MNFSSNNYLAQILAQLAAGIPVTGVTITGSSGSITAAGTNGTLAQAIQGITGGVPVPVTGTVSVNPEVGTTNFATSQVALSTAQAQLVAASATRQSVLVSASVAMYIGPTGVTTATGYLVPSGAAISIPTQNAVFGILASSTGTAYVLTN